MGEWLDILGTDDDFCSRQSSSVVTGTEVITFFIVMIKTEIILKFVYVTSQQNLISHMHQ